MFIWTIFVKSQKTQVVQQSSDENIADESESVLEEIVKKEELNLLRHELSLLSKQYRETTVLYYIENLSCSEVAKKNYRSALKW